MTTSAGDFKPISPNPYIVGNPVRGPAMFFGRAAEFELVRKRFQGQARGSLLVFCGERRSGKTSILFQILDGRLGADFIPVLIDMQSMAIDDEADFLRKIAVEVLGAIGESAAVGLPRFTEGSNHAARFRQFIREVLDAYPDKSLVLLFDEYELFENKIDAGVLSRDVLHILSNLMENDRVFIIFTGSQDLEARRRDYWHILGKSLYKTISYLQKSDALDLIERPLRGVIQFQDGVVESIYRLTAGQPFFTQAVCQSIVDRLNEERTYEVSPEVVEDVTTGLIQNPPPQMIFLWEALERDEKLVLALLAETLEDSASRANADDVRRTLLRREYPLDLNRARIATATESLFRKELLTRDEEAAEPGFAFRMDLWRRWVRRMHSFWQVMRELGVPIRAREAAPKRRAIVLAVASAAIVLAAVAVVLASRPRGGGAPSAPSDANAAWVALFATPQGAGIDWNGERIAIGRFESRVAGGTTHRFRLSVAGYADTLLELSPAAGDSLRLEVSLRPLFGALRVETAPAGAEIRLDGRLRGRSPLRVADLPVAEAHTIEAVLAGHAVSRATTSVAAGRETTLTLTLRKGSAALFVTSDPPGARVLVAGASRGTTPLRLAGLPLGPVAVALRRDGYAPLDTVAEVQDGVSELHAALRVEPPGILVLQGDRPARMFVDGRLIVENVQNSRPIELRAGAHAVQVILVSGETIDTSIVVRSGQRAIYDYSRRVLRWTAP